MVVLPIAGSAPLVGRVSQWGVWWRRTSSLVPRPPPPFIWHYATRAHQPCWVGRPQSGLDQGLDFAIVDQSNILPLISAYHLNFRFKLNILISFPIPSQISA
jgi:hypothetical protein